MTETIGKPGPFQIITDAARGAAQDQPIPAPKRRYGCNNYTTCLDLAAALNWDSFTCRGCCGDVEQTLLWRAHQARKHDQIVETLCEIPQIELHQSEKDQAPIVVQIAGKR